MSAKMRNGRKRRDGENEQAIENRLAVAKVRKMYMYLKRQLLVEKQSSNTMTQF